MARRVECELTCFLEICYEIDIRAAGAQHAPSAIHV
jgi:hypothetical protein